MTVGELIEELKKYDEDSNVCIDINGYFDSIEGITDVSKIGDDVVLTWDG